MLRLQLVDQFITAKVRCTPVDNCEIWILNRKMTCTKLSLPQIKLACTIMALVSFTSCPAWVMPQPAQAVSNSSGRVRIRFTEKVDGSSRGRPGRKGGTGSRGDCFALGMPLTALVPTSNLGLTVNSNPTFWFYVPYKPDDALSGEFSLQDEQNNEVYRTPFTLPGTPGIVSISLPSTKAPLEIGKRYRWYFKIYCPLQESSEPSTPAFVQGWVQRVSLNDINPNLESQLKAGKTPLERIALYAENGIWHEALTGLAELRRTSPRDVTLDDDWADLLRSVGLERLVQEPLTGPVKTNSLISRRVPSNTDFRNFRNGN